MRDFPELAEEIGRRAVGMTQAEADAGHRERTAQMIRPAELMAAGHSVAASPVQADVVDATPDTLAPALADAYLALKAAGRL
ncbi:hypothetical protein ACFQ77_40130 [Streptomyces virginiae]|uniref:hypothetical protein n=1 Tax=Streptomyces virginiae TaxID=1961 RepID=UPI0036AFE03D